MRTALETKADSAVVLRHAMHLSMANIIDKRSAYNSLKLNIETTKKSLLFWEQVRHFENKEQYIKAIKTRLEQCFNELQKTDYLELMLKTREANEAGLRDNLQLLIISLLKYYQTTEQIHVEMVGLIADRIIWKFGGLSIEDVAVCFNMAMNGDFGKVYNRIDGGVIMGWLQTYTERQQELIHQKNITNHADEKGSTYKDFNAHRKVVPKRLKEMM